LGVRTIAIVNQKGGCGKTTTAINLSAELGRRGLRTLLVDMDPQSHCAAGLGIPEGKIDADISDALMAPEGKPMPLARLAWRAGVNLDLVPSRMKLAGLEASRGGLADRPDRERRLAQVLTGWSRGYDVAVIDCSPAIGLLTFNALVAADTVLIPVETGFFAMQGAFKQLNTVRTIGRRLGVQPTVRLVPTLHEPENAVACDILSELRKRFGPKVAPVVIRHDGRLREAAGFGQTAAEYAPASEGAADYRTLASWVIEKLGVGGTSPGPIEPEEAWTGSAMEASIAEPGGEAGAETAGAGDGDSVSEAAARVMSRIEEVARRALQMQRAIGEATPPSPNEPREHPTLVVEAEAKPLVAAESVRRLFGVRQTAEGVLFVQPLSLGRRVFVAGDFNNWSTTSHPMHRNESLGVFELLVPIRAGRCRYRLVVDGSWRPDLYNPHSALNPYGEADSVVDVDELTASPTGAD
jgi:chromosome partitioning protein